MGGRLSLSGPHRRGERGASERAKPALEAARASERVEQISLGVRGSLVQFENTAASSWLRKFGLRWWRNLDHQAHTSGFHKAWHSSLGTWTWRGGARVYVDLARRPSPPAPGVSLTEQLTELDHVCEAGSLD